MSESASGNGTVPDPGPEPKRRGGRRKASADKPPRSQKSGAAKRSEKKAGELADIRSWLSRWLMAPAGAAAMAGDAWMVDHFTNRAPKLANAIVEEAERNEQLRRWLISIVRASGPAVLVGELAMFVGLPLIHLGKAPFAEQLAPVLGVPVLRQAPQRRGPTPGEQPPFVAPRRGPATAPGVDDVPPPPPAPEPPPPPSDELEAELQEAPPVPMEAV